MAGSVVDVVISDPVSVSLPPFLNNTMPSNNNVTVSSGNTVVLTDQVYDNIRVKYGATVTFTQKDIFINKLDVDNNATVNFTNCAFVRMSDKLDIDKYTNINTTGAQVWFYVDGKVDVDRGAVVNANIFALGNEIKVKGSSSYPTFMNGQFIGRKVKGDNHVTWDYGSACDPGCVPEEPITGPCDIVGEDSSEEWIEAVMVNNTTNTSGNDGGYGDYTSVVLPITTGNNSVTLTPGFSGSPYGEYWKIWIDLNNDGDFDDSGESVFSGASSNTINGTFSVPKLGDIRYYDDASSNEVWWMAMGM